MAEAGVYWEVWQYLAVVQYELLLFAGVFFLIGALDDFAVDCIYLGLKLRGRARVPKISRSNLVADNLSRSAAVFIASWQEAEVIEATISHILRVWPQKNLRIYVGVYRNDPETMVAAMGAAAGETRVRLVIHDRHGPSTKADCLNRLYRAMQDDEQRAEDRFEMVVFHDAEDLVDPAGLALLDRAIASGADFAQLPVEPLPQPARDWLGSHYCEEFAEAHGKAMVVRDALGAGLPSAGVGCAVGRDMLTRLAQKRGQDGPFGAASLTEDYEMGLRIAAEGGRCRFVRARAEEDGSLIATRAFFPSTLRSIIVQKTRWVNGIALQGWDRIGWGHANGQKASWVDRWMRARDRRGPMTAVIFLLGYALLVLTLLISLVQPFASGSALRLTPLMMGLIWANLGFLAWRIAWRFAFTARDYGVSEGLAAIFRLPVTNIVAIMAGWRALFVYISQLRNGQVTWDKTPHDRHPARPASPSLMSASREAPL